MEATHSEGNSAGSGAQIIEFPELVERLRLVQTTGPESDAGLTSEEIKEVLGCSIKKAVKIIKAAVLAGQLVVGKRYIAKDWDGRSRAKKVYCLPEGGK